MPKTATQTKPRQSSGWTPERRAKQAAAIRIWAPWARSTGPKTPAGKARVAQNAAKPWKRLDPDRVFKQALRMQERYITDINRYIELEKICTQNKLLKHRLRHTVRNRKKALENRGNKVTFALAFAQIWDRYVSNITIPHARHCEERSDAAIQSFRPCNDE